MELSTLQRCASHIVSLTDLNEAYAVGNAAVRAAADGHTGEMVLIKRISTNPYVSETDTYDIRAVANMEKPVPRNMINESGDFVTEEFIEFVRPLTEGSVENITVNGLSAHIKPL